jgi:hypothetical protein
MLKKARQKLSTPTFKFFEILDRLNLNDV